MGFPYPRLFTLDSDMTTSRDSPRDIPVLNHTFYVEISALIFIHEMLIWFTDRHDEFVIANSTVVFFNIVTSHVYFILFMKHTC